MRLIVLHKLETFDSKLSTRLDAIVSCSAAQQVSTGCARALSPPLFIACVRSGPARLDRPGTRTSRSGKSLTRELPRRRRPSRMPDKEQQAGSSMGAPLSTGGLRRAPVGGGGPQQPQTHERFAAAATTTAASYQIARLVSVAAAAAWPAAFAAINLVDDLRGALIYLAASRRRLAFWPCKRAACVSDDRETPGRPGLANTRRQLVRWLWPARRRRPRPSPPINLRERFCVRPLGQKSCNRTRLVRAAGPADRQGRPGRPAGRPAARQPPDRLARRARARDRTSTRPEAAGAGRARMPALCHRRGHSGANIGGAQEFGCGGAAATTSGSNRFARTLRPAGVPKRPQWR
jgi:hypothetical protein